MSSLPSCIVLGLACRANNFVYLYFCLGCIPIWGSRADIQRSMPECLKKTYADTTVIIECTELYCQVPSALHTQISLYSTCKHHVTYKELIGIALSGAVTFSSPLYQGRTSDKEIVGKCGLLGSPVVGYQQIFCNGRQKIHY